MHVLGKQHVHAVGAANPPQPPLGDHGNRIAEYRSTSENDRELPGQHADLAADRPANHGKAGVEIIRAPKRLVQHKRHAEQGGNHPGHCRVRGDRNHNVRTITFQNDSATNIEHRSKHTTGKAKYSNGGRRSWEGVLGVLPGDLSTGRWHGRCLPPAVMYGRTLRQQHGHG